MNEEQSLIIEQPHKSVHRRTWENMPGHISPKMKFKIQQFIKVYNFSKYDRHPYKIRLGITTNTKKSFEIVHIDIFLSSPVVFLSAVDTFLRFSVFISIKSRTITNVRRAYLSYSLFMVHQD